MVSTLKTCLTVGAVGAVSTLAGAGAGVLLDIFDRLDCGGLIILLLLLLLLLFIYYN